ncbi:MAG TPA: hypothetical protein PKE29_13995 [Phycisphaerales bacterium]|nr:hypothetical protein [Phycisphaerales bacterium]
MCILIGAWLLGERPMVQRRGWMWLVPTWPLVQTLPLEGSDGVIAEELRRRLGRAPWPNRDWTATMSDEQVASLFETCADGTWLARPTDDRWRKSFGPLARQDLLQVYYLRVQRLGSGPAAPAPLIGTCRDRVKAAAARLEQLHGPLTVRTRSRWPKGVPIHLEVPVETWWEPSMRYWMHVRWTVEGADEKGDSWCTGHTELTVPVEGHVRLRVDLEWVEGMNAPRNSDERRVLASASRVLEYDVVPTVDDAITPVRSAALDAALGRAVVINRDGMGVDWNSLLPAIALVGVETSFGVRIEYMLDGMVVGTQRCRFIGGPKVNGTTHGWDFPGIKTWDEARRMLAEDPNLKARIVTDPEWALYNIDATAYWKGETDVTLQPPKKK